MPEDPKEKEKIQEENIDDQIDKEEDILSETTSDDKDSNELENNQQEVVDKPVKEKNKQEIKKEKATIIKDQGKKEEKTKKKPMHGDDFKYIVRISNSDINGEKNVVYGLTGIKGIGLHLATLIADETGIDRYKKIGDLSDSQIQKIQDLIDKINEYAPTWMLNHRKDLDSGENIHLVGTEIEMRLRDEINILKKIRSYRGIRHERGLRVRGQRTKANNRRGLSLGVSKKRE